MFGKNPFILRAGKLNLQFKPILPGWLFSDEGRIETTFLGQTPVVYENPKKMDTWTITPHEIRIVGKDKTHTFPEGSIPSPIAELVRAGKVENIIIQF